ncbi:mRNA cap guanine-N7 methyltransferase-like [Paramacrobiotus metropolitanus]|uniref:mRNA cap guanine-N7 methyltransferase-like n=1 Tax=Paramacrobiotus metropolitanus TaxID=2943436 RepID=UPI0024461E26|nr:mRNA cap guanine-N7 methyltransferase-like [Paramacrobiotus metropolitanus]
MSTSGLKSTVEAHYNRLEQRGLEERKQSRIYHLRSFNNWVKSVCINESLNLLRRGNDRRRIAVLDLCCGKGGDLKKWQIGRINYLVCADMAGTSVDQCRERYEEMHRNPRNRWKFDAEFVVADCAQAKLWEHYNRPDQMFDLVSCQFSFHYSFETHERAERMLRNACERLRPGGIYIGTIPDSYEIMKRLQQSEVNGFGNEIFSVTFDSKERQPLFGARYHFFLDGHVDCPEFLVNFPLLVDMAKKIGMKLLYCYTFSKFFEEFAAVPFYERLLERMDALETYPSDHLVASVDEGEYEEAQEVLASQRAKQVGCLSRSEWEVASMYVAFAFQKEDDNVSHARRPETSNAVPEQRSQNRGGHRDDRNGQHRRDTMNGQTSAAKRAREQ